MTASGISAKNAFNFCYHPNYELFHTKHQRLKLQLYKLHAINHNILKEYF